jgi:HAD superfamily hydrolase (TIGR01549 family)
MPPAFRAILFDWDGTLLDSAEATYRCYHRIFASFSITFDRDLFMRTYYPDWHRTYEDLGLAREHWDRADAHWNVLYAEEPPDLIAGALDALRRIHDSGRTLGIVTSGTRDRVLADLDRHGIADLFEVVVCAGDTPERKPHPEPLRFALRRMEVAPGEAAYVGDSPDDIKMARAASVYSIAIPGGFPTRDALLASEPDIVATDLAAALSACAVG